MKIWVLGDIPEEPGVSSAIDLGTTDFKAVRTELSGAQRSDAVWTVLVTSKDGGCSKSSLTSTKPIFPSRYESSASAPLYVSLGSIVEGPGVKFGQDEFWWLG